MNAVKLVVLISVISVSSLSHADGFTGSCMAILRGFSGSLSEDYNMKLTARALTMSDEQFARGPNKLSLAEAKQIDTAMRYSDGYLGGRESLRFQHYVILDTPISIRLHKSIDLYSLHIDLNDAYNYEYGSYSRDSAKRDIAERAKQLNEESIRESGQPLYTSLNSNLNIILTFAGYPKDQLADPQSNFKRLRQLIQFAKERAQRG